MSPTIVVDPRGAPPLITGACGGPHIITAVFQMISNVVDYGMDISFAVSAPRFHHQHLPDTILLEEGGFTPDAIAALRSFRPYHKIGPPSGNFPLDSAKERCMARQF